MASLRPIALVVGLAASSYYAFGNVFGAYMGIMPATARGQTKIPAVDRLALWDYSYQVAKFHMGFTGASSFLAITTAAYLTSEGPLRNILSAGALAAFAAAVYTPLFMRSGNNELMASFRASAVKPMEPGEEKRVLDLLDKWRSLHRVRITLGLVTWVASATAVLATDAIIQPVFSLSWTSK
ncbi:hypothetical protein C8F04DRAFT_1251467 [Mycena alexandri]|uniref:DUF1772-domain-containing protein n=1 Tax=Mycena alexandri TaxID=1745969 RepID=A0AAD6TB92_9AGAR|nr:hypothetical protein C8F04DRAFT_1251467 [Mycena alexandri]